MIQKNYVCCLKDKFEMVKKGDHVAEYNVMKALSLIIYIFTIYFHELHEEDWQDQPPRHRGKQLRI